MPRNITEQKRVQAQLLDRERTLAMPRELHEGIGQATAAAKTGCAIRNNLKT
ncbi:MAG: hypothetical protein ABFD97_09935 [Syntrophobacter sp.]